MISNYFEIRRKDSKSDLRVIQSETVMSVACELQVGNSGHENINIDIFGTNVNEYFSHLIWHLADRKFNERKSTTGSSNCYVQLQLPTGLNADDLSDFCRKLDKYWNQKKFFMINFINRLFKPEF